MRCHREGPGVCGGGTYRRHSEEEARSTPEDTEKAFPEEGRGKAWAEGGSRQGQDFQEQRLLWGHSLRWALVPTGRVQGLVQPPRSDGRGHLGPGALSARPKPLDPIL